MSTDTYYPPGTFADQDGITVSGLIIAPPDLGAGLSSPFKCSHLTNSTLEDVTVIAGNQRENGWDSNRFCQGNTFRRMKIDGNPNGNAAIQFKCGFRNNVIDDVLITKPGKNSDWYEGDFADYYLTTSRKDNYSRGNRRNNVRRDDAQPVRVAWTFFRSEKPTFTNSNVTYQYGLSLIRTIYVELKVAFPKLIP